MSLKKINGRLIQRYFRFLLNKTVGHLSPEFSRLRELWELEDILSYRFHDWELFDQSLTHTSHAHEILNNSDKHYERLEFLGDAVLDLVISSLLMKKYPESDEGELSKHRSSLVNKRRLAQLALRLNLGKFLLLGKGEEQSKGRHKQSILSCVYEAVIGAIYLDGGFEAVSKVIQIHFGPLISFKTKKEVYRDYKSRLQEYVQSTFKTVPHYTLVKESGPPHDKEFEINLQINGQVYGAGRGKNKKEAQQRAAAAALKQLGF